MKNVYVHMLLYNSVAVHGLEVVKSAISAVLDLDYSESAFRFVVTDNGSDKDEAFELQKYFSNSKVKFRRHDHNLGFCAANNQAAFELIKANEDYLFLVNPDCLLQKDTLKQLIVGIESADRIAMVSPKLLRGSDSEQNMIDAAGMIITNDLRHFDRGSGEVDQGRYQEQQLVFGASGACLLLNKAFIKDAALPVDLENLSSVEKVFPQLSKQKENRLQLFDEAFFAYREDADLSWRAQLFGWKCLYYPDAVAKHVRYVLPEKRSGLPAEINLHGVRNRFLLQLNNYKASDLPATIIPGFIIRNLFVILAVILLERSSLKAFKQLLVLYKRGLAIRSYIFERASLEDRKNIKKWFKGS